MLPLGATWTRITSPHLCPFGPFIVAGSVGQSGSSRYGFGSAGLGAGLSARSWAPTVMASAATATAQHDNRGQTRLVNDMMIGYFRSAAPDLAPFSPRNFTTVSYLSALAASSAVRPSRSAALTSTPDAAASFTASRVSASRSPRFGGTHAFSLPPI